MSDELQANIEAILFAAGRAVTLPELCKLCQVRDPQLIQQAVEVLKHELKQRNSPLLITAEADGWKMTVGEKHLSTVREITPHTELSKALLETLAVIAWKQPILQSEVIKIRTSGAYEHIAELLKLGFINKNRQGRSYALKVTGKFFEYFDLPGHEALKAEFEKLQSTAEMQKIIGDQQQLGGLQVYPIPPDQQDHVTVKPEAEETLGNLEVFDEPPEPTPAPQQKSESQDTVEALRSALSADVASAHVPALEGDEGESAEDAEEHPPSESESAPPSGEEDRKEDPDVPRKLPAALESFAEEGKAEWGKGEKKEEADEPESTSDDGEKSGLDDKL